MTSLPYPFTSAMGDSDEMRKAIQLLDEVKESIIIAYQMWNGVNRNLKFRFAKVISGAIFFAEVSAGKGYSYQK